MTAVDTWLVFPSSHETRRELEGLLETLAGGTREPQKARATKALQRAAHEVLDVLIMDLARRLQEAAGRQNREVQQNLAKLEDHVAGTIRMVSGVLTNDRLPPLLNYFRTLALDLDDAQGRPQPFLGLRAEPAFAAEARAVIANLRDSDAPWQVERTLRVLDTLTDTLIDRLLVQPKALLDLGFVLRKTADGALALLRTLLHRLMHRYMPHLKSAQRAALADWLESLFRDLPADRYL